MNNNEFLMSENTAEVVDVCCSLLSIGYNVMLEKQIASSGSDDQNSIQMYPPSRYLLLCYNVENI